MTTEEQMPDEIYLIKNPELEEDEESHIIWSTAPDIYDAQQVVGKYIRADLANKPALDAEVREAADRVQQYQNKYGNPYTQRDKDIGTLIRAASAVQEPVEVTVEFLHEQYDDDELENADEFLKLLARDYPNGLRILI